MAVLIEKTQEKFGLHAYHLATYDLRRDVNIFKDTIYTLVMEWFPNDLKEEEKNDDDLNPEGTAIIEMDIHEEKYYSAIFVNGKTFAKGIQFQTNTLEEIVDWLEQETGLTYDEEFTLTKKEERTYYFHACIKGIRTYPSGMIEVTFDEKENLTFFAMYGPFPTQKVIQEEVYNLSLEQVTEQAKNQVKYVTYPLDDEEILLPIYAIEEAFFTNDTLELLPYNTFTGEENRLLVNETLYWDESLEDDIDRGILEFQEDISVEEAYERKPAPESFSISKHEQVKSTQAVYQVLQKVYGDTNGEWYLDTLHRDTNYIIATVRRVEESSTIFKRKLTIVIDNESFEPINYIDNNMMLEMFENFKEKKAQQVTKETAYNKLAPLFELSPYYVFETTERKYRLCGLLDCHDAVDATTGKLFKLGDL